MSIVLGAALALSLGVNYYLYTQLQKASAALKGFAAVNTVPSA